MRYKSVGRKRRSKRRPRKHKGKRRGMVTAGKLIKEKLDYQLWPSLKPPLKGAKI